jgi:hypothetical protein
MDRPEYTSLPAALAAVPDPCQARGQRYPWPLLLTLVAAALGKGDTIVQFAIDQASGELRATGRITETPVPVSLVWKTAAGGLPGMPSTGAGGASPDMSLGLLAVVGLGAAALARLRWRPSRRAPDAGTPAED